VLEAKLDAKELDQLLEKLEQAPEVFAQARREAFEVAAPELKRSLDAQIVSTTRDSRGKVRSWQGLYVGSRGGYAAVRPKVDAFAENARGQKTKYTVGYVTNAINSGHRFPGQGVRGKGKGPGPGGLATGRVAGRYFYDHAQKTVESIAQETVDQVIRSLIKHLEGL